MSYINRRLGKLEERMRVKLEDVKWKEEEKKKKKWTFDLTNEFMLECYPKHAWNSLSLEKRWELYNRRDSGGIGQKGEAFVSSKDQDVKLYLDVLKLFIEAIRAIEAREEEEQSEASNEI